MLTVFHAKNTVSLSSIFNSSNAIAMLALVSVGCSLLVDIVHSDSAYDFDSCEFQPRVFFYESTKMAFLSDHTLAGILTQSMPHEGTIGSHSGSKSIHTSTTPTTPGTNIIRVDTSPHGVEIPTPPADL